MLIDSTHKKWASATVALSAIAVVTYVPYSLFAVHGAKGGTIPGLIYGILGMALMLFVGLLSLRRKLPAWRLGRVQTWMRGHLWLGLLSFVLILCHGGFRFGGTLTTVLMSLFIVVLVSGIVGVALQQFLPQTMTTEVPMETIYGQIANVRQLLLKEADELVATVEVPAAAPAKAAAGAAAPAGSAAAPAAVAVPAKAAAVVAAPAAKVAAAAPAAGGAITEQVVKHVRDSYFKGVRPFLLDPSKKHRLASEAEAKAFFQKVRLFAPPAVHGVIDDLENICDEERQLIEQVRFHHLMYSWLLVHVPLSFGLLVLAIVHAFIAMRY